MAEVNLRNLVKTYPGATARATDDISLDIADGEFMVLLGPSGCGKTTLLRMVAGLELPDAGQVVVGGRDVTYLPPRERNLSMVFQSYAVFPHRRVRDNIGFGLAMRGIAREEIRRKVAWAADLLQLTPYLDRYPSQLSGGQRQRVAVARAIVVDADVLLMDEPLSNLDALLRLSFRSELKKLVQELGTTTLYVTHDQAEALSLGDRVAVMREGVVVQCDDPIAVYDRPASRFVGGFLGSPPMNFLIGGVDGADRESARVTVDLGGQVLRGPDALRPLHGADVHLGVRAETIGVSDRELPDALRATVQVFEPLGSAVLITADLAGQQIKVQAPNNFRVGPGDTVWLSFRSEHLRWYDSETQLSLETV
ncbi:carbohydrate ABC transporter ATP-binding protein, CUT1 family [Micromonospora rhizosphaerae]|uniref:Carbohydrate ABC transporter ATP-binding protein, CUT1 family n=1 Tax=Micromonospora rhizosphaerae TaxID=568872 RepID=A0A1C6SYJ1_9ACTN|nr:ABC transporter ATP-binding protein [Micromonospora rhizosphaerae]SCL34636.1 carbohydrate ABC transporter ATP-binding protein, CUT1 family [Micromonospora rhizosphaerae]